MVSAIKLTLNRKVKFSKNVKNTFGLNYGLPSNGGTCPFATAGKGGCLSFKNGGTIKTCYMDKIAKIYPSVGSVLEHNTQLVKTAKGKDLIKLLQDTVTEFRNSTTPDNLYFRLHYSGDFFSDEYTKAWATTINNNLDIHFWCYTRSFDYVKHLVDCKNLSIYISTDSVNYKKAKKTYDKYIKKPNVAMAFMGNNPPEDLSLRFAKCPETYGVIKNTDERGACANCRLCINRYKNKLNNIKFKLH